MWCYIVNVSIYADKNINEYKSQTIEISRISLLRVFRFFFALPLPLSVSLMKNYGSA